MATIFISDIHLVQGDSAQGRLFEKFLRRQGAGCDALYILGDLFDYWIGDDISPELFAPSIKTLKDFAAQGRPVYVMHGNRDFLLGEQFAALIGCQLIPDPTVVNLYGQRTVVTHGDALCTDDEDYQQFRKMVRDPAWQQRFLGSTAEYRLSTAKNLRAESVSHTKDKTSYILDVNAQAVAELMRRHDVKHMIHGHVHKPGTHDFIIDGQMAHRYVLGDWHDSAEILECTAKGCELKKID